MLTCNHVVPAQNPDYTQIEVTGSVGGRYKHPYPLTIVRRDEQADAMLLKLPEDEVWQNVRSAAEGHVGSEIVTFGFPFEQDLLAVPGSITGVNNDGRWLTNASLNRGMSGGPAFDRSGDVVGIVVAGYEEANPLNLLIPINFSKILLLSVNSPLATATPTPEPSPAPGAPNPSSQPNSYNINITPDRSLRAWITVISKLKPDPGYSVVFTDCADPFLDEKVAAGTITAGTRKDLIYNLQFNLAPGQPTGRYSVTELKEKGIYEIKCEKQHQNASAWLGVLYANIGLGRKHLSL